MYRGYLFSFEAIDRSIEEPLTPKEIAYQLGYIQDWCSNQTFDGPGLGSLTTMDRSNWAKNREYLINLHPQNAEILKKIEESLLVISFDDQEPLSQGEVICYVCRVFSLFYHKLFYSFYERLCVETVEIDGQINQ